MNILVPINVDDTNEKIIVTLPFDPDFIVEANSLSEALSQVTKTISPSIQAEKDIDLIDKLEQHQPENSQFLKIDLFSKGEHILMGFILFVILLIPYMFVGSLLTWLWAINYSPLASEIFTPNFIPVFSSNMATLGIVRICIFIAVWSIVYNYIYPRFLNFYSELIIKDSVIKNIHKVIITQCSFTNSNDYDLSEKLS